MLSIHYMCGSYRRGLGPPEIMAPPPPLKPWDNWKYVSVRNSLHYTTYNAKLISTIIKKNYNYVHLSYFNLINNLEQILQIFHTLLNSISLVFTFPTLKLPCMALLVPPYSNAHLPGARHGSNELFLFKSGFPLRHYITGHFLFLILTYEFLCKINHFKTFLNKHSF